MTALVERPDLSRRTALSKSALGTFDLCQTKSWLSLHDPRPFVPSEKVTFGSAVDAGVEVLVKLSASNQFTGNMERAWDAASLVIERDGTEVDLESVVIALDQFARDVLPKFDWSLAVAQVHLSATLEGLGECDGHPDIILGDNSVWDVKTSGRSKEVPTLELGFYTLLAEEVDPTRKVPRVGYMNYVRAKRPFWQMIETPVTDELRRWAYEKSAAYVRARKADQMLNSRAEAPSNWTMTGSAKFAGLCNDCPYSPALGGPCLVSLNEPVQEGAFDAA